MRQWMLLGCLSWSLSLAALGCGSSSAKNLSPAETDALIETMIANLDAPEPRGRIYAIMFLGGQWKKAEPAVPRLKELTKDKDPSVRSAAKAALERLGQ
jgi:hypothetical protein